MNSLTLASREQRLGLWSLAAFAFFCVASIALQNVIYLAVAVWVVGMVLQRRWRLPVTAMTWPLVGLACALFAASLLEGTWNGSCFGLRKIALMLFFFTTAHFVPHPVKAGRYLNLFIAGAVICGLWVLLSFAVGWNTGRAHSFSGDYMAAGGMFMLALVLALSRFLHAPGRTRWSWLAAVAVLAGALVLTYTRSSWIGAGVAILVLGAFRDWRLPAIVVGAAVVFLLLAPRTNPVSQRFFTLFSQTHTSNTERKHMWNSGWKMVMDRPLLGYGVDNLSKYYGKYVHPEALEQRPPHVHDTPLQLAINGGMLATLFYLAWVAAVLLTGFRAWRHWKRTDPEKAGEILGLSAAFLAFFVNGWFEFNFGTSQVIAIVYFLTGLMVVYGKEVPVAGAQVPEKPKDQKWELPERPKILFIRPRFRGDVLMASILPRLIKRDFPKARVDLLTEPESVAAAVGEPGWDNVISLPRRDRQAWWRTVRRIRGQYYDAVCDLFGNPRTAVLAGASGAAVKIGPQVRVWDALYDLRTQADRPGKRPAWESYLDMLRAFGMKQLSLRPRWEPGEEDQAWVREFLQERQLKAATLLGVFAGGSHPAKRWPLENFLEVARRVHKECGMKAVFVFGPKEQELKQQFEKAGGKLSLAVDNLTPGQLAALWARCSVVLANDAFPMHLGPAVVTPTIGLFGPGEPEIWFPYPASSGHRSLHQPPACWPCHQDECSRPECWEKITVDLVVEAVKASLKKSDRPDPSDRSNKL